MQGLKAYPQNSDNLKLESPSSTPRRQNSGADRLRSNSFTDASSKTEAALRAQLMELRRDLSTSQQEVEQTRLDLQQRQELLKSAAGEARREVLALRKYKEESEREFTEATLRIAALEDEIRGLKGELSEALDGGTEESDSRGFSSKAQRELDLKEAELHRLRANERVNAASKEALNAQLGELVEKLAALQADLEESQEAYKTLQDKVEQLEQQLQEQSRSKADLQEQLTGLVEEKEELASRAELLQNELDVVGAEGTEDRLSGAARLLDLTQQCEELKARLEAVDEAQPIADEERQNGAMHSEGRDDFSTPTKTRIEGSRIPAALDTADVEASTLSSPQADAYAEQPWSARLSSPLPSPQKQLLAELTEASKYLQGLNARLDVERDTHANEEGYEVGEEASKEAKDAITSFTAALNAVQSSLGQQKMQALLGGQSLVHIHADSSQLNGSHRPRSHQQRRLGPGLIGWGFLD